MFHFPQNSKSSALRSQPECNPISFQAFLRHPISSQGKENCLHGGIAIVIKCVYLMYSFQMILRILLKFDIFRGHFSVEYWHYFVHLQELLVKNKWLILKYFFTKGPESTKILFLSILTFIFEHYLFLIITCMFVIVLNMYLLFWYLFQVILIHTQTQMCTQTNRFTDPNDIQTQIYVHLQTHNI